MDDDKLREILGKELVEVPYDPDKDDGSWTPHMDALREQSECDRNVEPQNRYLLFGNGNIAVVPFRSEKEGPIDGVSFYPLEAEHVIGTNVKEHLHPKTAIPLASMHFTNVASVDVVLQALKLIKRDMELQFWVAT